MTDQRAFDALDQRDRERAIIAAVIAAGGRLEIRRADLIKADGATLEIEHDAITGSIVLRV